MKGLIGLFFILAVAAWSPVARAWPSHGFVSNCPQGSGLSDGCNPVGTFLAVASPSLWSAYARTSGQTWAGGAHPWSWNAPGIDYAIGPTTPIASLKDPSIAALPTGCTYNPTGTTLSGPQVSCDNVNNLTISGYDFSKNGCIQLVFGSGVSGALTISNNRFKNGPNCSKTEATFTGTLNSTAPTQVTVSSVTSGSIVIGDQFQGGSIGPDYTITALVSPGVYSISGGGCRDGTPCITTPEIYNQGKALGDIVHVYQPNTVLTSVTFSNNYFDGDGVNFPMNLGQFINTGASSGTVTFSYNVFVRMPGRPINIPTIGTLVVQYNYFEDFCYNTVDGHCEPWLHGPNDNQTQVLQQVSYNVFLQGVTGVFPGGTGLVWLGTGFGNNPADMITTNTQVDHNIFVANCVPNGPGGEGINSSTIPCTIPDGANVRVTSALVQAQFLTYTNMTFTSNFFDGTGAIYRAQMAHPQSVCTNKPVWTGNIDLTTGAADNGWDSNVGTGC